MSSRVFFCRFYKKHFANIRRILFFRLDSLYNVGEEATIDMTRKDCMKRRDELRAKRDALVDQLAETDTQSATLSAGGGSKSYTNRTVEDLKKKIQFLDREIARLDARLGLRSNPGIVKSIFVRYH